MVSGRHLTFAEHCKSRLSQAGCNHWGPAVYKWEGALKEGIYAGRTGVLIGETSDLRQRIKQYISGTQESGNRYWREQFLTKGEIYLFILDAPKLRSKALLPGSQSLTTLSSNNVRLVLEQLLVFHEQTKADAGKWIVNRKL